MANSVKEFFSKRLSSLVEKRGVLPTFGTPYMQLFGGVGMQNHSKTLVTPETANKVSAFYSCVRNICEDIAKLPLNIYQTDSKGNKIKLPFHPAAKLFNQSPNGFSNPFTIKETLIDRSLRKGNGYLLIQRDQHATPTSIVFLEYESVIPILENQKLFYTVNDPLLKIHGTFTSDDIFHLRGMGNGYQGISVLKYASESIGKAIATQDYAGKFYGSGANMTGLLKISGAKDETHAKKIKESFMQSYQNDGIGALQGAAEFIKMNFSADEAQMLGAQEFSVKDVARWFRMPLSKLQTSDQIANIEALAIEYVNDCLMPWICRFEEEIQNKLFTEAEKPFLTAQLDTFSLTEGDTAAQERRYKTLFYTRSITPNEIRHQLGMNSYADGDHFYSPVNMIPAELEKGFWEQKDQSKVSQTNPDSSGAGEGAISKKAKRAIQDKIKLVNELTRLGLMEPNK
jgi:HK97 family phage portal protein